MERSEAGLLEALRGAAAREWKVQFVDGLVKLGRSDGSTQRRSILVQELTESNDLVTILKAAQCTRTSLPEPEASALYLVVIACESMSWEEARGIESDERFCRKYVWRWGEAGEEFLRRTFVGLGDLPRPAQGSAEIGPRARIYKRAAAEGMDAELASALLESLCDLPEGVDDYAGWLSKRLAPGSKP